MTAQGFSHLNTMLKQRAVRAAAALVAKAPAKAA